MGGVAMRVLALMVGEGGMKGAWFVGREGRSLEGEA